MPLIHDNLKVAKFSIMPNFRISMNSDINGSDPGSLILQNFQNFSGKNLDLQVKMCFASKILPQDRTDFTKTTVFNFVKNNIFQVCLANDKHTS